MRMRYFSMSEPAVMNTTAATPPISSHHPPVSELPMPCTSGIITVMRIAAVIAPRPTTARLRTWLRIPQINSTAPSPARSSP